MTSQTTTDELLDAIDRFNEAGDDTGITNLLNEHAGRADIEALHAWATERRLERLGAQDLVGQGWWPIAQAAKHVPYSAVTIRYLIQHGQLGTEGKSWVRDEQWPFRLYISPDALSRLLHRDYRASGPRGPRKATA